MEMVPLPRRMLISFWQCLFLSSTNLAESMILFDRQVKKCFRLCFWMCLTTNSLLVNKFPCWKDQSRIFVKFCFMSCFVLWSKPSWWRQRPPQRWGYGGLGAARRDSTAHVFWSTQQPSPPLLLSGRKMEQLHSYHTRPTPCSGVSTVLQHWIRASKESNRRSLGT